MNRITAFLRRFIQPDEEETDNAALGPYGQNYAAFSSAKAVNDPYFGPAHGLNLYNLAQKEARTLLEEAERGRQQQLELERLKNAMETKKATISAYGSGVPFGVFSDPDAVQINPTVGTISNNIRFAQGAAEAQKTGAEALGKLRDSGIDAGPSVANAMVYDPITQTNLGLQRFRPDGFNPKEAVDMRGQDTQLAIAQIAAETRRRIAEITGRDPGDIKVEFDLGAGNVIVGAKVRSDNPNAAAAGAQSLGAFVSRHNQNVTESPAPSNRGGIR